jgi:hypothetical protein
MKYFSHVLIIFFGINCFVFPQQHASVVQKLSKDADLILTGKVTAKKSHWDAGKTKILTQVNIRVDEYLKAENNQKDIYVTHLGGEVGEVGELYSHTPTFKQDEEVLLFLKKDGQNNYKVLNGEDGKLTVHNDERTGEKVTSSNEKISELKNEIRNYIKQQK